MPKGTRVANVAKGELGVMESPNGSNWGPRVSTYIRACGIDHPVFWCGCFAKWCFLEANVAHNGLVDPGTGSMCNAADRQNAWLRSGARIPVGALSIRCGIHTEVVWRDRGNGWYDCVGGNTSNGVHSTLRNRSQWRIIVPPEILEDIITVVDVQLNRYWIVDPKVTIYGPWALKNAREVNIRSLPKADQARVVRLRKRMSDGRLGYAFQIGRGRRHIGPWVERVNSSFDAKAARNAALKVWEARLGHQLIPTRDSITVQVTKKS